jgi:hypothetical protein
MDDDNRADIRAEFVMRLLAARAPELSSDEIVLMGNALMADNAPSHVGVPVEVMHTVVDVIDRLESRLEMFEQGLASAQPSPRFTH